jgi:hypothetical protein
MASPAWIPPAHPCPAAGSLHTASRPSSTLAPTRCVSPTQVHLLDSCLELLYDPVANVRMHVVKLLPGLKRTIRLPDDVEHLVGALPPVQPPHPLPPLLPPKRLPRMLLATPPQPAAGPLSVVHHSLPHPQSCATWG